MVSRLARVREWLTSNGVESIGEPEFLRMGIELAIPEDVLRKVVREADVPLAALVEGVRQDTWDNLGRTLVALQHEYERGTAGVRLRCRDLVITAKDHALLAVRQRPEKQEMVECMRVWLENPPVFEDWWRLRVARQIG